MSKARRQGNQGPEAFESFYAGLYGDRWGALREALLESSTTRAFDERLLEPYYMDPASVLAAASLAVEPGDRVLDLCAAPGGKTLVLASKLGQGGTLVSNERSSARRARLHRVLDRHLPPDLRARVSVTGHDAARWALHEPAGYDRVLADVPCSSEQHVLQSAGALAEWSPSRTKRLAQGAYAIACAAVDAVRPGGRVVYATCALAALENDGVVGRLIARGAGGIRAVGGGQSVGVASQAHRALLPGALAGRTPGTTTEFGWMILPDTDCGLGPMYIAVLERARAPEDVALSGVP